MEPGSPKSSPSPCIYDLALCLSRLLRQCVKGLEMMNPFALRQHFPKSGGRWNLFTFSYPIVCCKDFHTQGALFRVYLLKMQQILCYHLRVLKTLMKRRNEYMTFRLLKKGPMSFPFFAKNFSSC